MNDLQALKIRVELLERKLAKLESSSSLPYNTQRTFQERGFLRATLPVTDIVPVRGSVTFYLATISGGTVDHPITFKDGILIVK